MFLKCFLDETLLSAGGL